MDFKELLIKQDRWEAAVGEYEVECADRRSDESSDRRSPPTFW